METLRTFYRYLITAGNCLQPVLLLVFRLTWGWAFYLTGKGKLLHHDHVVTFFTSLSIPAPELNAWFVAGLECFGGLLLMIGLCSRPIALLQTGNMLVAYISVAEDRAKLFGIFEDYTPFLEADPFFFLLTSVLILAFGAGKFSIDEILKNRYFNNKQTAEKV